MVSVNEKLEKAISRTCREMGLDDKISLELLKLTDLTLQDDILIELRTAITNQVFSTIDEDENWVSLKGKVSWDNIYSIVDNFIILDWCRYG